MVFINRSHVLILFVNFSVVGGCDDTYYGKTKPQACNFIKKETLAQVLSCELCVKFLRIPFLQNTFGRLPLKQSLRLEVFDN